MDDVPRCALEDHRGARWIRVVETASSGDVREGATAALGFEQQEKKSSFGAIPCRRIDLSIMDECITWRPRPVYMRVQRLGGQRTLHTYGSPRYIYLNYQMLSNRFDGTREMALNQSVHGGLRRQGLNS